MLTKLLALGRRFLSQERGAVLVEMTVITPLMITLAAGVFEFGNLIHQKLLIEAGLRDGARYGARCNSQMYTEYAGFGTIDCAANAENIARFGKVVVADGESPRVDGWDAAEVDVAIANAADCHDAVVGGVTEYYSLTAQVCIVRATSSFPYQPVGMLAYLGIGPITLNGVHEERYIRF